MRLWGVSSEMIASQASCPTPGASRPGCGAGIPGIMGQDAPGKGRGGHHEYTAIENMEFHSDLNYISYLPAVT